MPVMSGGEGPFHLDMPPCANAWASPRLGAGLRGWAGKAALHAMSWEGEGREGGRASWTEGLPCTCALDGRGRGSCLSSEGFSGAAASVQQHSLGQESQPLGPQLLPGRGGGGGREDSALSLAPSQSRAEAVAARPRHPNRAARL